MKIAAFAVLLFAIIQSTLCDLKQENKVSPPNALVTIGDHDYHFGPPNELVTWENAMLTCNALGMKLVSFETQEKYDGILGYMQQNGYNSFTWTSGRTYITSKWYWSSSGQLFTNLVWAEGMPHLTTACRPCVIFSQDSEGWMDTDCFEELAYICE